MSRRSGSNSPWPPTPAATRPRRSRTARATSMPGSPPWRHYGLFWNHFDAMLALMGLEPYVEEIRVQFAVAADAGGDEAKALADRLIVPLDSAVRLALQRALADAA